MQPPDELMANLFLPSIRQLVASELRARGMSQNGISALLGVTQASVSIYLNSDRERAYGTLAKLSLPRKGADRAAAQLADALQTGPEDGVRVLSAIWMGMLGTGSVCPAHRSMYPSLADCGFCLEEYGKLAGDVTGTVAEVSGAVKLLENSPEFPAVMPEVSVNIACAAGDAVGPSGVIAVPGRIVKVHDRARAMLPPEAGASAHMSRVLILARRARKELRAVINLRYDRRMAAVVRSQGLKSLTLVEHLGRRGDDPTAEAFERLLKASSRPFDVLIDEGGSGIEPNIYVFAEGAREAARIAIGLARAYSAA